MTSEEKKELRKGLAKFETVLDKRHPDWRTFTHYQAAEVLGLETQMLWEGVMQIRTILGY